MEQLNEVTLRGKVCSVRKIESNDKMDVLFMVLSTERIFKDENGEVVKEVTFHNVKSFDSKGRFNDIARGDKCYVKGRLHTERFVNSRGEEAIQVLVYANSVIKCISEQPFIPEGGSQHTPGTAKQAKPPGRNSLRGRCK